MDHLYMCRLNTTSASAGVGQFSRYAQWNLTCTIFPHHQLFVKLCILSHFNVWEWHDLTDGWHEIFQFFETGKKHVEIFDSKIHSWWKSEKKTARICHLTPLRLSLLKRHLMTLLTKGKKKEEKNATCWRCEYLVIWSAHSPICWAHNGLRQIWVACPGFKMAALVWIHGSRYVTWCVIWSISKGIEESLVLCSTGILTTNPSLSRGGGGTSAAGLGLIDISLWWCTCVHKNTRLKKSRISLGGGSN